MLASAVRRCAPLTALLLGAAATLGFAPFGWWPAAVLALAGLFVLCREASWRRGFALGWLFGLGHFGSGVYWVIVSTHVYGGAPLWLALLLLGALSGYLALYPAAVCAFGAGSGFLRARAGWLAVPAAWLLAELLRGWVFTGFPWLALGYVALDTPALNLAPLLGVHGLSWLLALSAFAVARCVAAPRGVERPLAILLALSPLAGWLAPSPAAWTQDAADAVPVAIVQGNVPQEQKWDPEVTVSVLMRYRTMTLATRGARLIVWPEAVPNVLLDEVSGYFDEIGSHLQPLGVTLLAGVLIGDDRQTVYNSMIARGAAQGRYDKRHLVPFGEYFPIPAWLRPVMDVLGLPYGDISSGAAARDPIRVDDQALGISICFEDVFGSEFALAARDRAVLVNATNDAWFTATTAQHQHLQIARLRAAETGRWLVRATNTGVSALIAPDGRVRARSAMDRTEVLRGTVTPRTGMTPYMRWLDAPLWAGALLLIGGALLLRRRSGQQLRG